MATRRSGEAGVRPVWHWCARLAAAAATGAVLLAAALPVLAADPTPNPKWTFDAPVILVWMDNHGTVDGGVEDKAYMLVPPGVEVKGETGHYTLADGSGGVFHYFGHDVAGPYTNARDLCPRMISEKISDLSAWPWFDHGISLDECLALAGLLTPAPAPTDDAGVVPADDTSGVDPTGSDLNLAAAIIWVLLLGGLGAGGVVAVRHLARPPARSTALWPPPGGGAPPPVPPGAQPPYQPLPPPDWPTPPGLIPQGPTPSGPTPQGETPPGETPPGETPQDPTQSERPNQQDRGPDHQSDPCAAEAAAELAASAEARGLHSVLETLRALYASLEQQIVVIEDAAIPTELGVETAFLAGSAVSKVGPGWVTDVLLGKLVEGVAKDELKAFIKKYLASAGNSTPGAWDSALTGGGAAVKTTLKHLIANALSDTYMTASSAGYYRELGALQRSLPDKWAAADKAAGRAADAIGNLLTLFKTGMSLSSLVKESADLREKAMGVYGDIAELEVELETAVEHQHEAARDLQRCRWVHTPGGGPLPPAP